MNRAFQLIITTLLTVNSLPAAQYQVDIQKPINSLRIMTWNIRRKGKERLPARLWKNRRNQTLELILDMQPDILCLQEVTQEQREDFLNNLSGNYVMSGEFRQPQGLVGLFATDESTPILVKRTTFTMLESDTFWLNPTMKRRKPGWGAWINRICTWVQLRHNNTGQIVWVFNTHLDHKSSSARSEGIKLIVSTIKTSVPEHEPVLLTGDFNARSIDPGTPVGLVINTPATRMFNTRNLAQKIGGANWTAFVHPWRGGHKTIDYILVNNPHLVNIIQHLVPIRSDEQPLSDHNPVILDFCV